jgi:hypothetical protein
MLPASFSVDLLNSSDLLVATYKQFLKDLNRSGIETTNEIIFPITKTELSIFIHQIVLNLTVQDLSVLLYNIDLSETKFQFIPIDDERMNLSEQILIREAQKVFFRMKYN